MRCLAQVATESIYLVLMLLALVLLALAMPAARAVEQNPPDKKLSQPPAAFQLPAVELDLDTSDDQIVLLKAVQFHGNTVVSTDQLHAIAAPYLARSIQRYELEELRQKLSRYYLDLGYVNSGVLWDGKLVDGVMQTEVIEGKLSAINLKGLSNLNPRYVTQRLSRPSDGPLNMEVLRERFQLLLADPLFQRLNARLIPGSKPGEAILDLEVQRARPYQLLLFANNYRPPSIGTTALGADFSYRNLTGQGDLLGANLQSGSKFNGDARSTLSWSLPLGYSGSKLAIVLDRGSSAVIEQPAAVLDIRSKLSSEEVGMSQALWESLNQKFSVGINYIRRENRSTLLGVPYSFTPNEVNGITKEHLWRCWQDYSYRTPVQSLALRSSFSFGRNNLAEVAGLPDIDSAAKSYRVWLGQAQWARQVLGNGAQLLVRATVQRSPDHLLPLDGLAVGGVNTVRGFRENQFVRDQGEYINLEFDYPWLQNPGTSLNVNLIPFIDHGSAHNQGGPSVSLSSAGLAGRLRWNNFNLDIVLAHKLQKIATLANTDSNLQDKGVHLQLSYKY